MRSKRIPYWLRVIFALLALCTVGDGLAEPIDQWHGRNPFPEGSPLRIYYGNGFFLAVGEFGAIYTSGDGANWTWRNSGTKLFIYDVVYGGGTFVAVGTGGTVLTSSDGVTWISQNTGIINLISGITYGKDVFVAVGDQGLILTSPNGADWTLRNAGTHQGLKKVVFGNNAFVAVGVGGAILTSPDGVTWTVAASGFTGDLEGITYWNNTFVAVGASILTSPDGATWTERPTGTNHFCFAVAHGSGTLVVVADNGIIMTSPDGSVWTHRNSGTPFALWTVAHGENNFVAAGEGGILLQSETLLNPRISVSPASIDFGAVPVGSSLSVNLTITNSGSADLFIQRLAISGPNFIDFITQNDRCTGTTLLSSQNCTVHIVFSPHTLGPKSATLSISSNDPDTPTRAVPLSGSSSGFFSSTHESYCFISFSTLGSELAKYIGMLRTFRDIFLMESKPGRMLVDFYYQHSPLLVHFIAGHDFLREVVQMGLAPLVTISYLALYTSPTEKAFFFVLLTGIGIARWLKMRRSLRGMPGRPLSPLSKILDSPFSI
ncbi:MAG: choice-of-anchor D domain-containing protein [Thermodesulfobacteriota bacterium]|nr:choice-of-anchor D domain-containing protein [Thermodesulfobacteriota bacterium]